MNTSTSRDAHRYFLSLAALVHSFSAGSQSQAALLKLEAAFHKYRPLLATILAQDAPKNPTERAQVEKGNVNSLIRCVGYVYVTNKFMDFFDNCSLFIFSNLL